MFKRIALGLVMPVFYTLISLGLLLLVQGISKSKQSKGSKIVCACVFVIFQLQPSMISTIISAVSCRKIGI